MKPGKSIVIATFAAAVLAAGVAGCGITGGGRDGTGRTGERSSEGTASAPRRDRERQADDLEDVDAARVLGVEATYARTGMEEASDGEPHALATVATGGPAPEERLVFALLARMISAAPDAPSVTVVLWLRAEPDARFAQYVWNRPDLRLERFEASIPASEYDRYAPKAADAPGSEPEGGPPGFEPGRTGVITGIGAAQLEDLAEGGTPSWESNVP
ncbi:MAG: hypothetical protein IBX62_02025 [Coriobacteriia bacterium]|nr:hypothetical protein [Coriobacteriia bacterium]